jgi:hypothetical protein
LLLHQELLWRCAFYETECLERGAEWWRGKRRTVAINLGAWFLCRSIPLMQFSVLLFCSNLLLLCVSGSKLLKLFILCSLLNFLCCC